MISVTMVLVMVAVECMGDDSIVVIGSLNMLTSRITMTKWHLSYSIVKMIFWKEFPLYK